MVIKLFPLVIWFINFAFPTGHKNLRKPVVQREAVYFAEALGVNVSWWRLVGTEAKQRKWVQYDMGHVWICMVFVWDLRDY